MSKNITLTNDGTAIVDDADFAFLSKFSWRKKKSDGSNVYHAVRDVKLGETKVTVRMHRLITEAETDEIVFHVNNNGLDNRRKNLQKRQIKPWTGRANESGFLGVHLTRGTGISKNGYFGTGMYEARIVFTGREYILGNYDTAEDAAARYDMAARELYGEHARVNFSW